MQSTYAKYIPKVHTQSTYGNYKDLFCEKSVQQNSFLTLRDI